MEVDAKINQMKLRLKQIEKEKHTIETELERLKRIKHHYKKLSKKETNIDKAFGQVKEIGP